MLHANKAKAFAKERLYNAAAAAPCKRNAFCGTAWVIWCTTQYNTPLKTVSNYAHKLAPARAVILIASVITLTAEVSSLGNEQDDLGRCVFEMI